MSAPRVRIEDAKSQVFQLSDGRWRGKVPIGRLPSGRIDYKTCHGKTKKETEAAVRVLERKRDSEGIIRSSNDPLLKEWAREWLDVVLPMANRSQKTINGYRSHMRVHVIPALGEIRLSEITPSDLTRLYGQLRASDCSDSVISGVHRAIRSCFTYAVDHKRLSSNPAQRVTVATPEEIEVEPLTLDEAQRIIEAAQGERNAARWSVGIALGLRQGEALGLLWDDIDLDEGTIRVRVELQRIIGQHGCGDKDDETNDWPCGKAQASRCPTPLVKGGLFLKRPKTRRSTRALAIPDELLDQLRRHAEVQDLERKFVGDEWGKRRDGTWLTNPLRRGNPKADLVFTQDNGRPIDPRRDYDTWRRLLEKAGVEEKRVHDMRHTCATFLGLQGVDHRTMQEVMGWSQLSMVSRYAHAVSSMKRDAAKRMGGMLWSEAQ